MDQEASLEGDRPVTESNMPITVRAFTVTWNPDYDEAVKKTAPPGPGAISHVFTDVYKNVKIYS